MPQGHLLRIVLGLALALALAVLAAHPKIRQWEQRVGVTLLLATGLPFLILGALFRSESVGILSDAIVRDLRPAFEFGLGWVGFVVGLRFDIRRSDKLPRSLGPVIIIQAFVPMFLVGGACALFLFLIEQHSGAGFSRQAIVLAACAAASAPVNVAALTFLYGPKAAMLLEEITNLDEVVALAVLGLVTILYRPDNSLTAWVLPPSAWFLVALGLGVLLGVVAYLFLRGAKNEAEEICFLLGSVALAAGVAGYLALSIPVTCALAGAMLANLPLRDSDGLQTLLLGVERPLYLVFLLLVGASWSLGAWQGWALAAVFVVMRLSGKFLGAVWAKQIGPPELPSSYATARALFPQSPIAIVVIVSAASSFNANPARIEWTTNAVLLGAILTELITRMLPKPTIKIAPALPVFTDKPEGA